MGVQKAEIIINGMWTTLNYEVELIYEYAFMVEKEQKQVCCIQYVYPGI